jgi:hypothetical protein
LPLSAVKTTDKSAYRITQKEDDFVPFWNIGQGHDMGVQYDHIAARDQERSEGMFYGCPASLSNMKQVHLLPPSQTIKQPHYSKFGSNKEPPETLLYTINAVGDRSGCRWSRPATLGSITDQRTIFFNDHPPTHFFKSYLL